MGKRMVIWWNIVTCCVATCGTKGFYWKVNPTMQRKTSMTIIHILRLMLSRGLFWLGWDERHTNVLITMGGAAREGGKSGTEVKKISLLQVGLHFHLFPSVCLKGRKVWIWYAVSSIFTRYDYLARPRPALVLEYALYDSIHLIDVNEG